MRLIAILILFLLTGNYYAQVIQQYKFRLNPAHENDFFGVSPVFVNNLFIAGSPQYDKYGENTGAAFLFNSNSLQSSPRIIIPPTRHANAFFGFWIHFIDDIVYISAVRDSANGSTADRGAVYCYKPEGDSLRYLGRIISNYPRARYFGSDIDKKGARLVIGSRTAFYTQTMYSGAVMAFTVTDSTLVEDTVLFRRVPQKAEYFGAAVSLNNGYLFVGAPQARDIALFVGAVDIFRDSGGTLTYITTLLPDTPANSTMYGTEIATNESLLVISAPGGIGAPDDYTGLVYIYDSFPPFKLRRKLSAPVRSIRGFGNSIKLRSDTLFVGALGGGNVQADGYAFLYKLSTGTDIPVLSLKPTDHVFGQAFGQDVDFSGNKFLVGSPQDSRGLIYSGSLYYFVVNPTGVSNEDNKEENALLANFPNPFNTSTVIPYRLIAGGRVQLFIYDMLGNEVAQLVNEDKPPGYYEVSFNASNLASGVYLYKLQAGNFVQTKKLVLLK